MKKVCALCEADISLRHVTAKLCFPCTYSNGKRTGGASASTKVNRAIKAGKLLPPTELLCVDCNQPAKCYDHRDYNKPLEVEPVCYRCNKMRGPAIYVKNEKSKDFP